MLLESIRCKLDKSYLTLQSPCFCALGEKNDLDPAADDGGTSLRETFLWQPALFHRGSSQTDRQCDRPVNRSQQRLCKLLMPNEKGQRIAKRVGHKPSLTLRIMCCAKTYSSFVCTAESEMFSVKMNMTEY